MKKIKHHEVVLSLVLGLGLAGSAVFMFYRMSAGATSTADRSASRLPVSGQFLQEVKAVRGPDADRGIMNGRQLFSSELRVIAMGSGYPIPYDAAVCPFSAIRQPVLGQMDRDGDGMTDDWELKFGLNKTDVRDALEDADRDGFSNLEEFQSGTDPRNAQHHPLYVHKLRFVEQKTVTFPLVFQGYTELADGSIVFQLNEPERGKSHFVSLGDSVENVVIKRFVAGEIGEDPRLYVARGGSEIELIRGKTRPDPEKQAELINILDRTSIIATMDALLSLHSDEYTVLDVRPDKVVVRHSGTGEVFDIVGLADGER